MNRTWLAGGGGLAAALLLAIGVGRGSGEAGGGVSGKAAWMIQSAREYFVVDSFAEAADLFTRALAADPGNVPALIGLGNCEWELGHPAAAEKYYERALAGGLSSTEDLLGIASFFRKNGKFDRAETLVAEARKHSPRDPSVFLEEGEINLARREIAKAAGAFRAAIDLDPADVRAYINLKYCVEAGFGDQTALPSTPPVARSVAPRADLPDIVLVSIDTLRADRLGCYGNPRPTSPALDAFAREAVLFENAISQSPHTAPSHMSALTGYLPDVHLVTNYGVREPPQALSPRIRTLAEVFRGGGYFTAGFYAPPNLNPALGFGRGFDRYEPSFNETALSAGDLPAGIREAIRSAREAGKPLFLFLHHLYCHSPYIYGLPGCRRRFLASPSPSIPVGPNDIDLKDPHGSFWKKIDMRRPDQRKEVLALYDGGVLYSDYLFGKIADLLREEGCYRKALIVVISDHGEEFHEHGGKEHERLFIEQLHVPLLIKFPGGRFSGRRVEAPVRLVDLLPALCEYLGLPAPPRLQGVSFLPLVTGEGAYSPRIVSFSVRADRVRFYGADWTYSDDGVEAVFSRQSDPAEMNNRASTRADLLPGLREIARQIKREKRNYLDLLAPAPGGKETGIDPATRERLRALGYVK